MKMKEVISEEIEMKQQVKEEAKESEKLLCPKAGTATSSPIESTPSQTKRALARKREVE